MRGTPAACHLPARERMIVRTTHPEAACVRIAVLDPTRSMLSDGEGRDGFGQVGAAAARHGLAGPGFTALHHFETDASKSFFVLDREACILCGRCTTACDDVQKIGASRCSPRACHDGDRRGRPMMLPRISRSRSARA